MFDLPMNAMILATQASTSISAASQIYAEVFNVADLDLGYEVAFPFLMATETHPTTPGVGA